MVATRQLTAAGVAAGTLIVRPSRFVPGGPIAGAVGGGLALAGATQVDGTPKAALNGAGVAMLIEAGVAAFGGGNGNGN